MGTNPPPLHVKELSEDGTSTRILVALDRLFPKSGISLNSVTLLAP